VGFCRSSPACRDVGGVTDDVTAVIGAANLGVVLAAPVTAHDGQRPRAQRADAFEDGHEFERRTHAVTGRVVDELAPGEVRRQVTHAGAALPSEPAPAAV